MKDIVRKTFEEVTVPNFRNILDGTSNLNRDRYGCFEPIIGDHWQTFQDGWPKGVQTVGKLLAQELTKTESVSVMNVDIEQLAQKITGE